MQAFWLGMGSWAKALWRTLAIVVCAAVVGCASGGGGGATNSAAGSSGKSPGSVPSDLLRIGDLLTISFSGPNPPADKEERIKEDGKINLPLVGAVHAEGKSAGKLQQEIEALYVPAYYKRLTVTVKNENRVFFVQGEVRSGGGRLVYSGEITVMGAIAAAGGFTDFAARNRVELVKLDGRKIIVDARKAKDDRKYDPVVVPGDQIYVPRRGVRIFSDN